MANSVLSASHLLLNPCLNNGKASNSAIVSEPRSRMCTPKASLRLSYAPFSATVTPKLRTTSRRSAVSVRCEKGSASSSGLDIWVGRLAMLGFVGAVGSEIFTGKGLLQNFGLTSPLPTVAIGLTVAVGAWVAFSIFRSSSES